MKKIIRKITPKFIIGLYHIILAFLAMIIYGNPSKKLIVIGVTGTNGKSTTVNLISTVLERAGYNIGSISTVELKINDQVWLNDIKMTMPGRFYLQKFLKQLVNKGCQYAVIETSSEGIKQYRHLGINYDTIVFTNLTPEHLESHGGFENYKKAKGKLFKHLTRKPNKKINKKLINKTIIVNNDDKYADYFLDFKADKKITYGIKNSADFQAKNIEYSSESTEFYTQEGFFKSYLVGEYNLYNILATIAVTHSQNIETSTIKHAIFTPKQIPGRMEFIENDKDFKILVDYAPEPESMKKLYKALTLFNFKKIIHVLGSAGGGRDKSRRPILGELAIKNSDIIIITNEDPYDENPQTIIDQVATGAKNYLKKLSAKDSLKDNGIDLPRIYKILDRKEAIKKALSLATRGDLVLITGKGCEQAICIENNKKIPWDDRKIIRELLKT